VISMFVEGFKALFMAFFLYISLTRQLELCRS